MTAPISAVLYLLHPADDRSAIGLVLPERPSPRLQADASDRRREMAQFEGEVWCIVREEREPLLGDPTGARWDPGSFDVLYTSLEREGSLAEVHFHLSRQPVFPSKIRSVLH